MEALTQARERQEEARRLHKHKCEDAAEAGTVFNGAIRDTLENTEALKKRAKTVTMRAEPLWTMGADFFKTLFERQEDAQCSAAEPAKYHLLSHTVPLSKNDYMQLLFRSGINFR